MMNIAVIIPAGGKSTRFGTRDKLTEDLGGRAMLLRTVEFFTKREDVGEIIVAGPAHEFEEFIDKFGPSLSFHGVKIIKGGTVDRWESVQNALAEVSDKVDRILIHDAARPALCNELYEKLLLASTTFKAVATAMPVRGTLKRTIKEPISIGDEDSIADSILGECTQAIVKAYEVSETIDRSYIWELQTPQIFDPVLIRRAYAQEDIRGCTDDAQVVEKLGEPVYLIEGDSRNIKVTTPADLKLVRSILGIRGEQERPTHKRF